MEFITLHHHQASQNPSRIGAPRAPSMPLRSFSSFTLATRYGTPDFLAVGLLAVNLLAVGVQRPRPVVDVRQFTVVYHA